jgi:hypothetical protein
LIDELLAMEIEKDKLKAVWLVTEKHACMFFLAKTMHAMANGCMDGTILNGYQAILLCTFQWKQRSTCLLLSSMHACMHSTTTAADGCASCTHSNSIIS